MNKSWRLIVCSCVSVMTVACIYAAENPDAASAMLSDGGLIGHWPMNDGQGYILKDVIGGAGDGEQIGAEWAPLGGGFCLKLGAPFKAGIMDSIKGRPRPNTPGSPFSMLASPSDGFGYARLPMGRLIALSKAEKLRHKTISLWVKPINGGLVPEQREEAFLLTGGTFLIAINSNRWRAQVSSCYKEGQTSIAGPSVKNEKWTHLVLMNDKVFARFYVNGEEVGRDDGPYLITNLRFPWSLKSGPAINISVGLGERGKAPPAFAGYVADLKMYNKTLSPEEVMTEYRAGLAKHME